MTYADLTQELKRALEALIAEAQAKGPGRIMTAAERDAVLWVTDREEGPRDLSAFGVAPRPPRTMH
jgi:hypothetical protein